MQLDAFGGRHGYRGLINPFVPGLGLDGKLEMRATDVGAIGFEDARRLAIEIVGLAHRRAEEDVAGQRPEVIVRREVGRPARRMVESRAELLTA